MDKTAGTLTVSDNGIGMSKEEMEENLGTIAHSGSFQFKNTAEQRMTSTSSVSLASASIPRLWSLTVISKKFGEEQAWKWVSSGADGYTIEPCDKEQAGTDVTLKLKADTEDEKYSEFLQEYKLRMLVRKYSDYIRYPIKMEVETSKPTEETKDDKEPKYETVREDQTLNSMVPSGRRPRRTSRRRNMSSSITRSSTISRSP